MQAPETITLQITLTNEQIAAAMTQAGIKDRHKDMVEKYGEACSKAKAARIISCSTEKIANMIEDGRIKSACEGTRVDVRSLADYIERRPEADHAARMRRKGKARFV